MEEIIMSTPGIADPYFYEWYIGIKYLIEMLNPDSGIKCVVFQHEVYDTIDDVVVEYNNGNKEMCYQVKHEIETSSKHNLTFGKLLEKDPKSERNCLLDALFQGWKKAYSEGKQIIPVLYTNRSCGKQKSARTFNKNKYTSYPIEEFFLKIKEELNKTSDYCNMVIQDENLSNQWGELCHSINETNINEIADFIKKFQIMGNEPSLIGMEEILISSLMATFSCNEGLANELLSKLIYGLKDWVTTRREKSRITVEDVYSAISVENDINESQHRLAPPFPFFESRKKFSESIIDQISSSSKKIVFISGNPGSGKTSIISYLQSTANLFLLRYHTFRPISPEQHFYNMDSGICSSDALWGTLLIQLRQKFSGKLAEYSVPVNNKLLTTEMKRHHVCRLLGIMAKEYAQKKERIYICIDGIDHAARSKTAGNFLSSLPLPNEIPDGVCFVIVGQPYNMYKDEYPLWLSSSIEVEHISVPNIEVDDIKQLIIEKVPQFIDNAEGISRLVYSFTEGNNLSSVFAVEEIKKAQSPEDAVDILKKSGITNDIQQYYFHIWNHVKRIISEIGLGIPFPESIIACPILLLNGRVQIRILANALPYGLKESDWKMLLDMLYPLVIPCNNNNNEYTLFHNDFRIFLMQIINGYQERYREIAYNLAMYLLDNNEGITSYVLSIPLLQCANKTELIPKYFTSSFVINSLSEGVSKQRLDEYAHLSYNAACANHDIDGYINTYLALNTLYQHQRYIEYYDKPYICHDAPELSVIDISEVRTLSFSERTISEYSNVLKLCVKLHLNNEEKLSIELYNRWFSQLTPFSFVPLIKLDETVDGNYISVTNEITNVIKEYGETTALLKIDPPLIEKAVNDEQIKVVSIFGKAYFDCCIEHGLFDLAILAIQRDYVTINCFFKQLNNIYYNGYTDKFADNLLKIKDYKDDYITNFFPLAMFATYHQDNNLDLKTSELTEFPDKIYDSTSLEIVVKSFLIGVIEQDKDDIVVCSHVSACYEKISNTECPKDQLSKLCKFSCLLGKYYWYENACNSSAFIKYTEWFLTAQFKREHDYSSAYKFLVFTLFNSKAVNSLADNDNFISAIKINILERRLLGMYYKTYMLNYLKKIGRCDVIKEYIEKLYGNNCENIVLTENKADLHNQFCHYGAIVAPDLMRSFTDKLKWDVVGYIGHKENAMSGLYNELDMILSAEPHLWRDYGLNLYCQSKIASLSENEYDYDIIKCILKAAISCGIKDFWELHLWDEDFQMNSNIIYESLFLFSDKAIDMDDVKSIWMLNCGVHSWYTNEDRIGTNHIYNYLVQKSQSLGVELNSFVVDTTPQWSVILKHFSEKEKYTSTTTDYFVQRQEAIVKYKEYCQELDADNILEFITRIPFLQYPSEIYKIVIEHIKSRELLNNNIKNCLLDSICNYTKGMEWIYSDLTESINSILDLFGEEAFWILATSIEDYLSEYSFQTSTRNIQMLLLHCCKINIIDVKSLFNKELETQKQWVTANNHIKVNDNIIPLNTKLTSPKSILEASLFILLEQIETHNARKIETAVYSIYVWGYNSPAIINMVIKNLSNLSSFQKEWIYPIIFRWAAEGKISAELFNILFNEYKSCNALSHKYYLHSILLKKDDAQVAVDNINYDVLPIEYTLPLIGTVNKKSIYENFLTFRETEDSYYVNDDIRRYISIYSLKDSRTSDKYCKINDLYIPSNNSKVDCMLYGEGSKGRWDNLPLVYNKSLLLEVDDPYMLTDMPNIVYDNNWFPNIYEHSNKYKLDKQMFSKIALSNIGEHEVVVAATIWYPVEYKKFFQYNLATKIRSIYNLCNNNDFAYCIGNYGLLENEGEIIQNDFSYKSSGSINLFNLMCGPINIQFGNCQIAPSSAWEQILECNVSGTSPYVWINEFGKPILRFERFASPINEDRSEIYFSQPILFRWVCDKEWLNSKLTEMNLQMWYIEKYDKKDSYLE